MLQNRKRSQNLWAGHTVILRYQITIFLFFVIDHFIKKFCATIYYFFSCSLWSAYLVVTLSGRETTQGTEKSQPKFQCILRPHTLPFRYFQVPNRPKRSQMFQMVPNVSKWCKLSQMFPNGPKWSQIVPNVPRWLQMVPNCAKWSHMVPDGSKLS